MEDNQLAAVKSRSSPAEIRRKWLIEQAELKKKLQMEDRENMRIEKEREDKRLADELARQLKEEEERLQFKTLQLKHSKNFSDSLPVYNLSEESKQELRQTSLIEKTVDLSVIVSREDFPAVSTEIQVSYHPSSSQADWGSFLEMVRKTLNLEYIHSIIDRRDNAAIHRIQRLIDRGEYFVRITETSAVVEALITRKIPIGNSWEIAKYITSASEEVVWHEGKLPTIDKRVDELIARPQTRLSERLACEKIIQADDPETILESVNNIMTELEVNDPIYENVTIRTFDPEVDIVTVHRLSLESLNRLALRGQGKKIATVCINFLQETIERFKEDTDVVVLGLRLISEIMPHLVLFKLQILHVLLNCVQLYAPPPHPCRPRNPKRLDAAGKELLEKELAIKREEDRLAREAAARKALEEKLRLEEKERRIQAEKDELERIRLEEEKKQEKFRRKIAKAKAKQQAALRMLLSQGITPEVPVRSIEEIRSIRKWSGSSGDSNLARNKSVTSSSSSSSNTELLKPITPSSNLPPLPTSSIPTTLSTTQDNTQDKHVLENIEKSPRNIITLKPLPVVPGVRFRGLSRELIKNMCLTQALGSIYKFVSNSFGYREAAYLVFLHEELSEVALVCQSIPRALQYILLTIDCIFSDGLRELDENNEAAADDDLGSDLPSMITSMSPSSSRLSTAREDNMSIVSVDPLTGIEIEAISEATMQTVDLDYINEEPTPRVNLGDPNKTYKDWAAAVKDKKEKGGKKDGGQEDDEDDEDEDEEEEEDFTNIAVDLDPLKAAAVSDPSPVSRPREKPKTPTQTLTKPEFPDVNFNSDIINTTSKELVPYASVIKSDMIIDYRGRYLTRPFDPLVICMAMLSKHNEIEASDREMAAVWIRLWDDASLEYKALIKRGYDYTDL